MKTVTPPTDLRRAKITKAVIPVAGLGTRMLPATKAIPKEMLPVLDKPLIQHVVQEAIAAGMTEIVLVTHSSKNSIENHFDTSFELEATLEKRVKRQLLDEVRSIVPKNVTLISVRQPVALGLGNAIMCAYPVVGHNPFAILLPDVLIDQHQSDLKVDNLAAMMARYSETGASQIMVEPVPRNMVDQYGVVDLQDVNLRAGTSAVISDMVEKPAVDEAPSNFAITGRYVLSEHIWDLLAHITPGAGDEIQLTDAIYQLCLRETIEAYHIVGKSHDCGTKLGLIQANLEYALQHDLYAKPLRATIERIFADLNKDKKHLQLLKTV
ncbi:UTP--glucose-1-phosphate uridylyltransferase [Rheinheimera pacifica]|uniref:UTP--glucose-1-phosphate uridylyltransferase GalU n=1 Tax=Rheinheimera pacifica TaxID=173990 RepID=UPI000CC4A286|nr:UTP--glucose-1-phosphate uridylyltransferase GalU [Rheinheimera pacifica]MDR6982806.1 UTP--glucose-1-phosphate uridylyltransferase [Rheinheimera pacifica]PKM20164.1 MAG: UTP--glucose-1-phosphate uridylyltransferase [Gammaproteobacteria bacterium HGW-Gammaproteobacteria-15]